MDLRTEIALNQFGQGLLSLSVLQALFRPLAEPAQRAHLTHLSFLIGQSKAVDTDIASALLASMLKRTYTLCVVLQKWGLQQGITRLLELPAAELEKVYHLLLYVFKEAYQRRYALEKDAPHKWWYWDLSSRLTVQEILSHKQSY
jgi:hypothetical protein